MNEESLQRLTALSARRDDKVWHDVAELILGSGNYRWVGLYEVTPTEIAAIVWAGEVAPPFRGFHATRD